MYSDFVCDCALRQGIIAPPTIAIIMTPEPSPVSGPSSATPSVKMLGNMIELKKPTRIMLHIATWPVLSIEIATRALADMAQIPSNNPCWQLL